jgi:hypothetical protein
MTVDLAAICKCDDIGDYDHCPRHGDANKVHPFHSGSQYMDWRYRNCERCTKSYDNNGLKHPSPCDIDNAISMACIGSGKVSKNIAQRMGAIGNECALSWDCPELTLPDEDKR